MKKLFNNQSGATAIEYALICSLIVIACVASFTILGGATNSKLAAVSNNVSNHL